MLVILWISETHHRITVHKDTISLVGNDERHGDLSIVLEEFLILSLVVELVSLMLAEAIEILAVRRLEHLTECISVSPLHFDRLKGLSSTGLFTQKHLALRIGEPHLSCSRQDISPQCRGHYCHGVSILLHLERGLL